MHSEKTTRPQTLTPSRWAGSRVLETVHRLNARCLALLAEAARRIACRLLFATNGLTDERRHTPHDLG